MREWAVTIGLALLVGAACFFWGRSTVEFKPGEVIRDTVTVTLPPLQVAVQGSTMPEAVRDTLPLPVVADTSVTLGNDSVKVRFQMHTTYYPQTRLFVHDFTAPTVQYPVRHVEFERIVTVRDPWWVKPAMVLGAVGAGIALEREEYALAAAFGGVTLIGLTVDF